MRLQRLADRLRVLERGRVARPMAAHDLVRVLVSAQDRQPADVVALEVHQPGQLPSLVRRRPGEALQVLVTRAAAPGASLAPIFHGDAGESEAGEALRLMLGMSARLRQAVAP